MNYKDILSKLPSNWQQITLKDYIKLSPVIADADTESLNDPDIYTIKMLSEIDKNIQIISLLTDVSVEDIEQLTMVQLDTLVNKISFIASVPVNPKTSIKYKAFNELSYDAFITFEKLSMDFTPEKVLTSAIQNLPTMLSVFSKDKLTEEQVLNLSMPEVIAGFFLLNRNIKRYLRTLERSSYLNLMKIQKGQMKNLLIWYWKKVNPFKASLTKSGTIG